MKTNLFRDRAHAGEVLGDALAKFANRDDVIVLALPRGGVVVGYEVARKLKAPLDVLVVRKLGVPGWEELAMGAIATGGVRVLHDRVVRDMDISKEAIEAVAAKELAELQRREMVFRGHTGAPDVRGKTVLLVDDGIATGSTIRAAVDALRRQDPAAIVIAVPTAAPDSCAMLAPAVDELIALMKPADFRAVGQWYADFTQTTDEEVTGILKKAHSHQGPDSERAA